MCTGYAGKWQTELKCLYKQRKDEIMKNSSKWKMWRAILDLRTCLICRKNHGKIYATDEFVPRFHRPIQTMTIITRLSRLYKGKTK